MAWQLELEPTEQHLVNQPTTEQLRSETDILWAYVLESKSASDALTEGLSSRIVYLGLAGTADVNPRHGAVRAVSMGSSLPENGSVYGAT